MRSSIATLLIITVVSGAGLWVYTARAICDVPIEYRIGDVDAEFSITFDEIRTAASDAESLWEDATGRNLFTYDPDADFAINFVFDERQAKTQEEMILRSELEQKKNLSEDVRARYDELTARYTELKDSYDTKSAAYQESLEEHNAEVARWNEAGGAPEGVYEDLNEQQEALAAEQRELNELSYDINQLVEQINAVGSEGNDLVDTYNDIVDSYNERFSEHSEFTQGDYQHDAINIYQFTDGDELRLVLAHEFGHALSLGHVENELSIMHHFMDEQDISLGLTAEDMEELSRVCGEPSLETRIAFLERLIAGLRDKLAP